MAPEMHECLVLHERHGRVPDVDHRHRRPEVHLPPRLVRPHAPVDVLVIDEESLVQLADLLQRCAPHQQETATHPVDVPPRIGAPGPDGQVVPERQTEQSEHLLPGIREPEGRGL